MTFSAPPSHTHARLIRRLETIAELSSAEKDGLAGLPLEVRHIPENTDIVSEGDKPTHCVVISEGLVCRYKMLAQGQRQIMHFHMAGDIPDLQTLHLKTMDHNLGALTPTVAGFIPHSALHELIGRFPNIGSAFWRETLIDAAVFREWLLGVGRKSAHGRVSNLICELYVRMRSIGLAEDGALPLPITQIELGDALGLSSVHINRVLQDLRRDGLIGGQGRTLLISDLEGLKRLAQFDPTYLHLRRAA